MLCSLLQLSCRKMGARPGLDLILSRNGFQVIINDDFLEEGECYISSLTTASGSTLWLSGRELDY